MKKGVLILIIVVVLLLSLGGWFIGGLNRVVILDENVNQSWAQIENQLQRRNDLIPNLVNTVKGYAGHEEEIFTKVTELRSQWGKAATRGEKITAAKEMGGMLSRLLLVAENYPDLKANENFLTLQSQLEGTENRIAVERRRYNQAVMVFNAYRRTIFGSMFAGMRGLTKPAEYFEAEEAATAVPEVKF
ncbi:MAG: LemA family protein [Candidatus Omnitrophica bacterium]|nr:LemA family protein [Candidatus Omnitrophota bacterium]